MSKYQGHVDLKDELACDSVALKLDFQDVFSSSLAGVTGMVLSESVDFLCRNGADAQCMQNT